MTSQLDVGPGRPLTVPTEGGPVAALESGPADGTPVLLVPGYTGSKEDFGPLLGPLADAGMHTVTIDLPGQFESPPPATPPRATPSSAGAPPDSLVGGPPLGADDPARYSPDALGATLRAVAATLGPRVHLVGHSFGGIVSRAAVIAAPDAFASLALMDSGPSALGGERARRIELLAPFLPELGVAGIYAAAEAAEAAGPGHVAYPAELAAFMRRRFLAGSPAMLLGMGDALLAEPDRVAELAAAQVPLLVLYGAADDAWPPATQDEMAARLGVEPVVIAGAAHSPAVENPSATAAALLSFWRAHR